MYSAPWLPKTFVLGVLLLCSPWRLACGSDDQKSAPPALPAAAFDDPREQLAKELVEGNAATAAAIRKALLSKASVDADAVPLSQLIDRLAKMQGLQWTIDNGALLDEGIRVDQPVDLHVADITLKSALRLILAPLKLTTVIQDEVLTVTTAAKAADLLETRVYAVGDLGDLDDPDEYTYLIEAITSCVKPESWEGVGGQGSVRESRRLHSLVVRQTQEVHEEILALLRELNRLIQRPPKKMIPPAEPDPIQDREIAIRQMLSARSDFTAVDQPLGTLLKHLAVKHHLPLWIDHGPLKDERIELERMVSIDLRNVRIETALNHLLRPLKLTWGIEDEVLKVTTTQVMVDLLVTRAYDIGDFVKLPADLDLRWPPTPQVMILGTGGFSRDGATAKQPVGSSGITNESQAGKSMIDSATTPHPTLRLKQGFGVVGKWNVEIPSSRYWIDRKTGRITELTDILTSTIEPDEWDGVGGQGSIREFSPNIVVVRVTRATHEKLEVLLHQLRSSARMQKNAPQGIEPADPNALKLFVYHFTDKYSYPTEPLAKLIPEVVARETWQSAGGKGTLILQPTSLVIRQTPAVHREIVKLLYDVVLQAK